MHSFLRSIFLLAILCAVAAAVFFFRDFSATPSTELDVVLRAVRQGIIPSKERIETSEQLYERARERSARVKALYMSADVAHAATGTPGARLRERLIGIAADTEINGFVIDVKEVCGPDYNEAALRAFLDRLGNLGLWRIARIVVFKDASQRFTHPEWYLTREASTALLDGCARKAHLAIPAPRSATDQQPLLWQDDRGGYWLDPAHPEVRRYILNFSRRIIDMGFDELQFDYIRFPSDGDVRRAIYPAWDGVTPKHAVLRDFFGYLARNLRLYQPDIVLSADLFGDAAIQAGDTGIGQRLEDIGDTFDYISFMVYPSHFYSGLELPADHAARLPALRYTYSDVRMNQGVVVERALLMARHFLDGVSTSTSKIPGGSKGGVSDSVAADTRSSRVRLRPWLEDFFHEEDRLAGRPYGAEKVRLQIDAAERVEEHGWLLWNAANVYTVEALQKDAKTR